VAQILVANADELAWLEALDTGNPFQAMRYDVEMSVGYMEYFAGLVTEIKGDTIPIGPGTLNYTLREPLGVVGRIGAFNHPLLFTAGKCGAPLVSAPFQRRTAMAYDRAKAVNAAAGGGIDDVIDPADTRDWIASGLKRLPPAPARTTKKYPYIDPW